MLIIRTSKDNMSVSTQVLNKQNLALPILLRKIGPDIAKSVNCTSVAAGIEKSNGNAAAAEMLRKDEVSTPIKISKFSSHEIMIHIHETKLELCKLTHKNWILGLDEAMVFAQRLEVLRRKAVREQSKLVLSWFNQGMKIKDIAYVLDLNKKLVMRRIKYAQIPELIKKGLSPEEIAKRLDIRDLARFYCGGSMSEEQERQALAHYKKNFKLSFSGEILKVNPFTIRNYLIRIGVYERRHRKFTEEHYQAALKSFKEEPNMEKIGKELGFDANTIKYHLKKRGEYISEEEKYKEREAKAKLMKEQGYLNVDIAEKLGLKVRTLSKKFGSDFKDNMPLSDQRIWNLIDLRLKGLSMEEIAKKVGASRQCVSRYLRRTEFVNTHPIVKLSKKEIGIIWLVANGLTNNDIGRCLGNTEHVVKNYLRALYDKVGISDRLELTLWGKEYIKLVYSVNGKSRIINVQNSHNPSFNLSDVELSPKDLSVINCLNRGMSIKETAHELNIAQRTAKAYYSRLFLKAGIKGKMKRIVLLSWIKQNQSVKKLLESAAV